MVICQWTPVRENCASFLSNISSCLVQYPPLTLPHINDSEAFLLYVSSPEFIELSFFATVFHIFFNERRTKFLTGTKVGEAPDCFKHAGAMRTKTINTEADIFLLSTYCKKLSILQFDLVRWKWDLTIFSKLRVLFCEGVNLSVCRLWSRRV